MDVEISVLTFNAGNSSHYNVIQWIKIDRDVWLKVDINIEYSILNPDIKVDFIKCAS